MMYEGRPWDGSRSSSFSSVPHRSHKAADAAQHDFRLFDYEIHFQPVKFVVRYNNNENSEITFEQRSFEQLQIYEKQIGQSKI